ncbi:hypothetical protein Droror1_Dr00028235, partial [Drosera rotundifolia]
MVNDFQVDTTLPKKVDSLIQGRMHFSPSLDHVQRDKIGCFLSSLMAGTKQDDNKDIGTEPSLSKQAFPRYGIAQSQPRPPYSISYFLNHESLGPLLSLGVSKSMWKFGPDANRPPPKEHFVYQASLSVAGPSAFSSSSVLGCKRRTPI